MFADFDFLYQKQNHNSSITRIQIVYFLDFIKENLEEQMWKVPCNTNFFFRVVRMEYLLFGVCMWIALEIKSVCNGDGESPGRSESFLRLVYINDYVDISMDSKGRIRFY